MCFNRLKTAAWSLQRAAQNRYGLKLNDAVPKIWDLADFFATGKMLDRVAAYATKPLEGLKVVCYYGCMANRPPEITESTNHENPQSMDLIVRHLGAEAIQWPYKTDCCGASQALSRPDIVFQLVGNLLDMAQRVGALAIVVSCQMCQANLDMYQERIAAERGKRFSLPVYYFSELIGIACELKEVKKWLSRHITDPFSLLRDLKLLE
jgi:heterodisulfide reductase subunit B